MDGLIVIDRGSLYVYVAMSLLTTGGSTRSLIGLPSWILQNWYDSTVFCNFIDLISVQVPFDLLTEFFFFFLLFKSSFVLFA